jgi:hypothetical protein
MITARGCVRPRPRLGLRLNLFGDDDVTAAVAAHPDATTRLRDELRWYPGPRRAAVRAYLPGRDHAR